jgi:large subunit ribosomal protein L28
MAKCDNCGKTTTFGHNVSHAKNRTPRRFRPNLQKVTVRDEKSGQRVQKMMCAKCIKAMSKIK